MKIQMNTDKKILDTIAQAIFDKKGFNILALDVRGISTMADYFLIAEGNVERHVKALSYSIKDELAELDLHPLHTEGEKEGDWIVMDYGDFVIHLFTPELREKYTLEQLWKKAKIVDLDIAVGKSGSQKGENHA